jgi:hypothetical protein
MGMITTVRAHRIGTDTPARIPGYIDCDRCGLTRADRGQKRSIRNLCLACTLQLTPEQLEVWNR